MEKVETNDATGVSDVQTPGVVPTLGPKEMRSLKRARYDEMKSKWPNSYVVKNRDGKIAELRAVSMLHACNLLGWRLRHVKFLSKDERGEG